jgi:exopolysaccharide production protein ExoF
LTSRYALFQAARRGLSFSRIGATLLALLLVAPAYAQTADYQLGSMDKLHIRVVEWQTAEGAVRDWSALSGDYIVGPSGNISLPFIGELPAAGKTTADIAVAIGEGLQQKLGLPDRPDASVELAEFRPVFVSGDVETPGKYQYDPQLTVLKAVSLAGGLRRSSDSGGGAERNFVTAQGNYDVLVAQRNSLVARRARLAAEADGKQEIAFPEELKKTASGKKLIADETAFMGAREKRLRLQLAAIDDLKQLLQSEISSLEKKIATQNRQVELSRDELQGIGNLKDQGLVVNARVLSIEQTIAELEGKVLDMETASLRAKQDIAKATQDATALQNDRDAEIAQDRQQTEADIEEVTLKMGMHTNLMAEALAKDPAAAGSTAGIGAALTSYAIVRTTDGKSSETTADENTPVLPGDVVKVVTAVAAPAD